MNYRLVLLMTALIMLPGMQASAEEIRELAWDDLIPTKLHFDDPFEKFN